MLVILQVHQELDNPYQKLMKISYQKLLIIKKIIYQKF